LIPLRGHTEGHAGVAIQSEAGWLLHAGDAYLHHSQIKPEPGNTPGLRVYQHIMDTDRPERRRNQQRLRDLRASRANDVRIFCSHDRTELAKLTRDGVRPS
jgi:glyoxylase-like metal-dependent hydrolase (beta-lactamase superfamily II)